MENGLQQATRPFTFRRSGLSFPSLQRWFIHHVAPASLRARHAD
jgi:hypothetical protein